MTVITYKDGVMAGDTGWNEGYIVQYGAIKVVKGESGFIYGVGGLAGPCQEFIRWVQDGEIEADRPQPVIIDHGAGEGDFQYMEVIQRGSVDLVSAFGRETYEVDEMAIGAAHAVATGALAAGASAIEAAEVAVKHHAYANGEVIAVYLDEKGKP